MLLMECVYVYIHTIKTWSASYFNFLLVFELPVLNLISLFSYSLNVGADGLLLSKVNGRRNLNTTHKININSCQYVTEKELYVYLNYLYQHLTICKGQLR